MAFPTVQSISAANASVSGASSGDATLSDMPSGVQAGDLLLLMYRVESDASIAKPTGWSSVKLTTKSSDSQIRVCARIATGSGDTPVVPRGVVASPVSYVIYRISGAATDITEVGDGNATSVQANGTVKNSAPFDPDTLTASWGSADNLWVAYAGKANTDWSAYPSGYASNNRRGGYDGRGITGMATETTPAASATGDSGSWNGGSSITGIVGMIVVRPAGGASGAIPKTAGLFGGPFKRLITY